MYFLFSDMSANLLKVSLTDGTKSWKASLTISSKAIS